MSVIDPKALPTLESPGAYRARLEKELQEASSELAERDKYWQHLIHNIYSIATGGKSCAEKVAVGMATSAVDGLVLELARTKGQRDQWKLEWEQLKAENAKLREALSNLSYVCAPMVTPGMEGQPASEWFKDISLKQPYNEALDALAASPSDWLKNHDEQVRRQTLLWAVEHVVLDASLLSASSSTWTVKQIAAKLRSLAAQPDSPGERC